MMRLGLALILSAFFVGVANAQNGYPPEMPGFEVEVYKTVGDVDLNIYRVGEINTSTPKPAIVFFFGGGWRSGTPKQFEHQAKYLATRGMIAFIADYRVASRHQITADECVKDAKSAVRWIRTNAERLGVDPDRIVAAGGSAGGHIAACTGVVPGFENEDESVSAVPNAMVLFNPVLVLANYDGITLDGTRLSQLATRLGVDPQTISPIHFVQSGQPPAIIFHGTEDDTVPLATAERFAVVMNSAGNFCALSFYAGEGHGFFNVGNKGDLNFRETMREADEFLVKQGFLEGPATIDDYEL